MRKLNFMAVLACMLMPLSAMATNSMLTGTFLGDETATGGLPGNCGFSGDLWYQVLNPVTVDTTGVYVVQDVFNWNEGVDVTAVFYEGSFDPANPTANLVTPNGVDIAENVTLNAGVNYVVVVQTWCANLVGAWAVALSGPGVATSNNIAALPTFTEGAIAMSDPLSDGGCGTTRYKSSGPTQVSRSGIYYFSDLSINFNLDMCLQIYQGSFDPANPEANRIAVLDDIGNVTLEAGVNYEFVVQPLQDDIAGEYFYALAPPAPFEIGPAISGAWFSPATNGTGILMDALGTSKLLFIAWFTFDLERPAEDAPSMIGDPGHRWITGLGAYSEQGADLDLYWTSGMIFDSATPPPDTVQDGSMTIDFESCIDGTVTYDLGASGVTGTFPITRLSAENAPFCETQFRRPGEIGPL